MSEQLNQTTIKEFLLDVFFGADKEAYRDYVLPIQGNWWNPVDKTAESANTWIGYSIVEVTPQLRTCRYGNEFVATCLATVHLQCVGAKAEQIARSLIHWDVRSDVAEAFARFSGQLLYDKRRVVASMYYQDGMNSTLAYNVDFHFLFADVVTPTDGTVLTGALVGGSLIIPS